MSNANGTNGAGAPQAPTIDQVRELLFGNEQRTLETQLGALREELKATRAEFERELAALRKELTSSIERSDAGGRERLRKTGDAISEIGRTIASLAEK